MPNVGDILEPILADLDLVEEQAKAWIASNVLDDRPFVAAMARICASLRPVLEQANELAADLEVAQHEIIGAHEAIDRFKEEAEPALAKLREATGRLIAERDEARARITELEAQLADVRKGFAP